MEMGSVKVVICMQLLETCFNACSFQADCNTCTSVHVPALKNVDISHGLAEHLRSWCDTSSAATFLPETRADVGEATWFIQNNKLKVSFVGGMVVQCWWQSQKDSGSFLCGMALENCLWVLWRCVLSQMYSCLSPAVIDLFLTSKIK